MASCHFGSRSRVSKIFCPPSPPCCLLSMAGLTDLTTGFKAILTRANVPSEFMGWLKSKRLYQPMDLYLLALDEARIDEKIINACKPDVRDVTEPAVEVSIRKAWLYCKDSVKDPKSEEKKEFDVNECTTLDAAWEAKYAIKLTTRERVGKQLMKRLYNIAHCHPPDFDIILLEQITLYSMSQTSVQQVKIATDGSMLAQQQVACAVTTAHGVIDRITALLYSYAYVSSDLDGWCKLDDSRECVQEIWSKMQHSERHQAPVSFYNDAYIATCQTWQSQIVTCQGTLSSAMQNKASWVAFWDYNCPGCPQCPGWRNGKGGKGAAALAIDSTNRQNRRALQNAVYKTMERYNRSRASSGDNGGKYGGKSGGKWTAGVSDKETRKWIFDKGVNDAHKGKGNWHKGKGDSGKGDWNRGDAGKGKGKDKRREKGWY